MTQPVTPTSASRPVVSPKYRDIGPVSALGYPLRTSQRLLGPGELASVRHQHTYRAQMFNMEDSKDLAEFCRVMDCIVNRLYARLRRTELPPTSDKPYRVFLEWSEPEAVFAK